jgi:hypothetical protein
MNTRIELLAKFIINTAPIYNSKETNARQKALMETIVGAGVFYLPSGIEYYNGCISQAALDALGNNNKTKLVKEHPFPRKITGKLCYTEHLNSIQEDLANFEKLYCEKFGRWNYVLESENKKLIKCSKNHNFIDAETSYLKSGIELVEMDLAEISSKRAEGSADIIVDEY